MNTQQKKLLAVAAVVLFHGTVVSVMLAQHGCKSDGTKPTAVDNSTPVMPATPPPAAAVVADSGYAAPTRPPPEPSVTPVTPMPVAQFSEPLMTPPPPTIIAAGPAAPTPVADATPGPAVSYVVSKNESLWSIAQKNGITVAELVAANAPKVTANSVIQPGQSLNIPSPKASPKAAAPAAADSAGTYKVVSGDSLSRIAAKNHTSIKALSELNNLTSPNIFAGQILKLPAPSAEAASPATSPSASGAGGDTYTVKSGDSVDKIARNLHISSAELLRLNGLTLQTASAIRPGRVLNLPSGVHAAPAAPVTTADSLPPPITSHVTSAPPPVTLPVIASPASGTDTPPMTPVR